MKPIYSQAGRTLFISALIGFMTASAFWGLWSSTVWILLEVHWFLYARHIIKYIFKK